MKCIGDIVEAVTILRVLSILGGMSLLAACDQSSESNQGGAGGPWAGGGGSSQPVAVVSELVTYLPETVRVEAVGTARARASAQIYPEAGGEVTEVLFRADSYVDAGDALLRLESREEALNVRLAEVTVQEAEQLLARYQRIENTGAVSDTQIDEARTALETARIQLERAQVELAERDVIAPFSGHMGLTDIDAGARITPSTPIARLDDRAVLFVDFVAPEELFNRVEVGDVVAVSPFAELEQQYDATVVSVDSRIDPTQRAFVVRAQIDNKSDKLRPGMSFRVQFAIEGAEYPAIPEAAILWGSEGAYVWGVIDGAAARIPITIQARSKGQVLVQGDLPRGSRVIAEGVQKVREGAPVSDWSPSDVRPARTVRSAEQTSAP